MKRVLTYGTYDLLHVGHINMLKRARGLGDYLIVGLSNDAINAFKGKKVYHDYQERKEMLEAVRYVDLVIEESDWDQKRLDIEKYQIDVLVAGEEWKGDFDYLNELCEVIYLPRTEGVSTSKIMHDLLKSYKK